MLVSWRVTFVFLEPKFIWGSKNKSWELLCFSWKHLSTDTIYWSALLPQGLNSKSRIEELRETEVLH